MEQINSKIGYIDVDVSGTNINLPENNNYYSAPITFSAPANAIPIAATIFGNNTVGVTCTLRDNVILLQCNTSVTLPSSYPKIRTVRVAYYKSVTS